MLNLPSTFKLFVPALLTFTRRPSLKSKMESLEKEFQIESLNNKNIDRYKKLLGYRDQTIPLTYLYLLAQRAQIALMLDKKFLYPLMGMVHMDNEMESIKEISSEVPIQLSVKAEQFFNQEKNRIEINFQVEFKQDSELIAICKSKYLALSGKRAPRDKKQESELKDSTNYTEASRNKFKTSDARQYAYISGDYNFIHLSPLLAKLFGFKSSILHGMYLKGLMGSIISNHTNKKLKRIYVQFKKPLLLPNEVQNLISHTYESEGEFKSVSANGEKEFVSGRFELK